MVWLVGMFLAEQDDEWAVGRNYFSAESMALIDAPPSTEDGAARAAHRQLITCCRGTGEASLIYHGLGLDLRRPNVSVRAQGDAEHSGDGPGNPGHQLCAEE